MGSRGQNVPLALQGEMNIPHGLVVDHCEGRLHVADREAGAVHQFDLLQHPPTGNGGDSSMDTSGGARRLLQTDAGVSNVSLSAVTGNRHRLLLVSLAVPGACANCTSLCSSPLRAGVLTSARLLAISTNVSLPQQTGMAHHLKPL